MLDERDNNVRFLPSQFALNGNPVDPAGGECLEFACPECHVGISRANLTAEPVFTSVVGAPRSGKSFLLAAATWQLRRTLPMLGLSFQDASPRENLVLQEYGQRIFQPRDPNLPVLPLRPTDAEAPPNGVTVRIRDKSRRLLKPFQFHYRPNQDVLKALQKTPGWAASHGMHDGGLLALYDNPGEDYISGSPGGEERAEHIRHSKVLLFVLNPLAEKRLRDCCDQNHVLVRNPPEEELQSHWRQELVLSEVISRITRLKGLLPGEPLGVRVVVAISKSDVWPGMYRLIKDTPYRKTIGGREVLSDSISRVSRDAKKLIRDAWPEFVDTADSADQEGRARFFPVSLLDPETSSQSKGEGGRFEFCGRDVQPCWMEVPFLWSIARAAGLMQSGPSSRGTNSPSA